MRGLRWGVLLLLLMITSLVIVSHNQNAVVRAALPQPITTQPLTVLEANPGTPKIGDQVSLAIQAEDDAISVLYVNEMQVSRLQGSGIHSFQMDTAGRHRVRIVRKTSSVYEEAIGVIPVELEEYGDYQGDSLLLIPTAKLDDAFASHISETPIFSSSSLRVIAWGVDAQNIPGRLGALSGSLSNVKVLTRIGAVAGIAQGNGLATLLADSTLDRLELDVPVRMMLSQSVPLINATQVWAFNNSLGNITGKNVTIAIIDSGIDYTHIDLGNCTNTTFLAGNCSKVLPGYDYVNGDVDSMDDNGHGTHVAGIAGANGTVIGVAPDATLIAYKVLDNLGNGYASDVVAAIENASAAGYDIISLSLGGSGNPNDAMSTAVDNAVAAGAVVVVAAGNNGPSAQTISSPGTARLALTVGNTNKSDGLRTASSRGPNPIGLEIKPEIMAPGTQITSLNLGEGNLTDTGTSMSTPHVSGAAALIKQLHPDWNVSTIRPALIGTARDLGLNLTDQGAGRLDALAAVNVSFISEQPTLSMGTKSSRLNNVTATFNLTDLSNRTYNLSLVVSLRTGDGNVTLNASVVELSAMGTASVQLFINLTTAPEGVYSGLISANSSDTNISIPFWVQVVGWRIKLIDDTTGGGTDSIYVTVIADADNDGDNEIYVGMDSFLEGFIIQETYNPNGTWSNDTISNRTNVEGIHALDVGDVTQDGLNDIASGGVGGQLFLTQWNGSKWYDTFINDTDSYMDALAIGDVDNDGDNEIASVGFISAGQGSLWVFDHVNGSWNKTQVQQCGCQRMLTLAIGDANNDGLNEIVARTTSGGNHHIKMYSYNSTTGNWSETHIDTITGADNDLRSVYIADPDLDG